MKKFTSILLILALIAAFTLATGCSDKEKEEVEEIEKTAEELLADTKADLQEDAAEVSADFKGLVDTALDKVDSMEDVADEDIHKAMDYITEHMDEAVNNPEVKEKLAYYAACLKYWTRGTEHEISEFADEAYDYAKQLYTEGEEGAESLIEKAKNELKNISDAVSDKKDVLVSDIKKLIGDL